MKNKCTSLRYATRNLRLQKNKTGLSKTKKIKNNLKGIQEGYAWSVSENQGVIGKQELRTPISFPKEDIC